MSIQEEGSSDKIAKLTEQTNQSIEAVGVQSGKLKGRLFKSIKKERKR